MIELISGPFKWPSGQDQGVLVLRLLPHELREEHGWEFELTEDELGSMHVIFLRLSGGDEVMLSRRRDVQGAGTSVSADSAANTYRVALNLLRDLAIGPDDVEWLSPYVLAGAAP